MIFDLHVAAFLVVLSAAYLGNLLAWATVWLWRKARHTSALADQARQDEADRQTTERYRKENPTAGQKMAAKTLTTPRNELSELREDNTAGWNSGAGVHSLRAVAPAQSPADYGITEPHRPGQAITEGGPNTIIVGPPMVGNVTLRDWAIHYTQRGDVWKTFVADFYAEAASDPYVLQVFVDAATARGMEAGNLVEEVQRHFLRSLLILTHVGLTNRLAQTMHERHAHLGITEDIYGRTTTALVKTATCYNVPQDAMNTLAKMIAELKPYLVTA